jgi:ATP-dependent helicase HepA
VVRDTMDVLLTSELGNCTLCAVKYPQARPGTLLLECLYILEGGHRNLIRQYHLAPALIRVVMDEQEQLHDGTLTAETVAVQGVQLDDRTSQQVVQAREQVLRKLLRSCESQAAARAPSLISAAGERKRRSLQEEIERLRALSRVNPAIREEECAFFETQLRRLEEVLKSVSPRLDAVRVMVAT